MKQFCLFVLLLTSSILVANDREVSYEVDGGWAHTRQRLLEPLVEEIKQFQCDPRMMERAPCFKSKGQAVVVGSGTTAMLATVAATRMLPPGSSIYLMQRSHDDPHRVAEMLGWVIDHGMDYYFGVSKSWDLIELNEISSFILDGAPAIVWNRWPEEGLDPRIFIHTADCARRYKPDTLDVDATIAQIVRRASVAKIGQRLEEITFESEPELILQILVSSECSVERSKYRVPNLGPYQIGKLVGDELFREQIRCSKMSTGVIFYCGPMATRGQAAAREMEGRELIPEVDLDPMESLGAMFRIVRDAYAAGELEQGKVYGIYAPNVNEQLGVTPLVLKEEVPAPYLWDPL